MKCKHNRIIKVSVLDMANKSPIIAQQYKEIYTCSHCGTVMEVKEK